ncbi:MAG: sulfite exporter TauE/SafE family protein, partial [Flavobacteriales bacterium]|nr:sulfite exporter TauE/SafE family protein [Flavobacteriales bacterium]
MKKPMELTTSLIISLIIIGLIAGMLSGFVGVGGGLIIVPALIWLLNFNQFQAQGTSLAVLLLPVGILAVMNYYKAGHVNMPIALIIGAAFIIG